MNKFLLIAGPCAIESYECMNEVAETLKEITDELGIDYYFKASFDKANRSSIHAYRGVGIEKGMEMLQQIKDAHGLKTVTDIHEAWQAPVVAQTVDMIQIPAFLCRQTDLLIAAAHTGKRINVKKAQFLAPWDMKNVVEKLRESGASEVLLCERGSSFGYNRLVVDMASIYEMRKLGCPVIFDATHSVQRPGALGMASGGNRAYVEPLARAAIGVGIDGLFMEVHPDPEKALSDGPNMIPLAEAGELLTRLVHLNRYVEEEMP